MNFINKFGIDFGYAICYSGYRKGQSPLTQTYPSYEQVLEDLQILEQNWQYLRIYDCSYHADLVLNVITNENLNFKIMLGADLAAEINNPQCPWGAQHSEQVLNINRIKNDKQITRQIKLANKYTDIIFALSIGNESSVEWSDHLVPIERLIGFADKLKKNAPQPITFCESYAPWTNKLECLVEKLDFISLHIYPVWEYHNIEQSLEHTKRNFKNIAKHYSNKAIIVTEAGWTTKSNGRGIETWNASENLQTRYYQELMYWSERKQILVFIFEAFDEPWKGSSDPSEPEKHWGIFTVERKPKLVMQQLYPHLQSQKKTMPSQITSQNKIIINHKITFNKNKKHGVRKIN